VKGLYTDLLDFPDAAVSFPARQITGNAGDRLADGLLNNCHQCQDVRVGRYVGEVADNKQLVFTVDPLWRRLDTRPVQPACKRLRPTVQQQINSVYQKQTILNLHCYRCIVCKTELSKC